MPYSVRPGLERQAFRFTKFYSPLENAMAGMPKLESRCNRPLQMTFEDQIKALVYFHLEEHHSARQLLQVLEEDDFARNHIAPEGSIKKSNFSEAVNGRGLEQMMYIFQNL